MSQILKRKAKVEERDEHALVRSTGTGKASAQKMKPHCHYRCGNLAGGGLGGSPRGGAYGRCGFPHRCCGSCTDGSFQYPIFVDAGCCCWGHSDSNAGGAGCSLGVSSS